MKPVLPPTYFFTAIVVIALLHFLVPIVVFIPLPWRVVGLVPLAAGTALNLVADRQFKQAATTVKPFQESSALITDGCFRWSRNPMYLGMVLIAAAIAIFLGSASPWIAVTGLAILFDRVFIAPEERMLDETFGDTFRDYRRRVRRWL